VIYLLCVLICVKYLLCTLLVIEPSEVCRCVLGGGGTKVRMFFLIHTVLELKIFKGVHT
jgi:hypothetical protein